MDIRWFIASLWRISVFALYTFPLNTIKAFLLPLSFIASWILPIAPRKMSGVRGTNPQVHDFDKIYDYKTLEDFGYVFHNDHMADKETGESFIFDVYDGDREKNQIRYEQIGKAAENYVYKLLEEEAGLKAETVPIDAKEGESTSFIFTTDNLDTCEKLMLIIHGAGVVRAGQWARRLIINHSLESGTQLPYIKRAKERGYGIIVTNTNLNKDQVTGTKIKFNDSPKAHFDYVWEHFVQPKLNIKHVAIVAHSYGGVVTVDGALKHEDLIKRVFAVAFTDSVHSVGHRRLSSEFKEWFKTCCRNWVSSDKPLNEEDTNEFIQKYAKNDCPRLSAGTSVHEETSWKAFEKVWEFIDVMLEERLNPKPENFKRKAEVTEKTDVKSKVRKVQVRIKDFFKGSKIKNSTENHQSKETVDEVGEDVAAGYVDVSENTENDGSSTDVRENKNKLDSEKSEFLENQNNESKFGLTKEDSQESDMDIGSGNNKVDRQNNPIMEDGENSKTVENKNNESETVESKNMEVESQSNEDDGQDNKITENKNKFDIEKIEITENQNNRVEHVLAKEDSHESDMDVESANNNNDGDNKTKDNDVRENKNKFVSKKSEFLENQNNESELPLTKEDSQESDMDIGSGNNKVDRQNNPIMEDGENSKTIENKKNESEIVEIKNMEVESKSNEDDGQDTKITENKNEVDIEKIEITENQNNRVEHVLAKEDESDIDVESANNNSDGDDKTKDNEDVEADKANDEYGESKTTKDDGDKETTENKKSENDYTQAKSDFQEINIDVDKFSNSQENGKEESLSQTPSEEL